MRLAPIVRGKRLVATALAIHVAVVVVAWTGAGGDAAWFLHLGGESEPLPLAHEIRGDVPVPLEDGHDGARF